MKTGGAAAAVAVAPADVEQEDRWWLAPADVMALVAHGCTAYVEATCEQTCALGFGLVHQRPCHML